MDTAASGHAAALWVGLHVFLLLTLSLLVVRLRQKHKVALGDEGIPELARAIRAFGNAAEYIPTGLAAIAVLALVGAPPLALHLVGLMLFAGRLSHAIGLSNSGGASIPRAVGMVCTWLAYIFSGVALLFYAIG
ncbi:MAPEG family protein [Caulobacter sp. HMWF025]|uniref:MAPEG family protein n=2 Tax=unclassified Caulobacter TaxID=2648921 RepID=UPI000D39EBC4|nr:MAPEG family protein [Caulobacter sp. HMWF025]PTT10649.1 glutathione S-transferase [Caulobacter sp. HMWF025]PTT75366.1 glutathione S-transferase [Pseudomonas sp. HMWF010]